MYYSWQTNPKGTWPHHSTLASVEWWGQVPFGLVSVCQERYIYSSKITEYVILETSTKFNQFYSVNLTEVYLRGQVLNCVPFYEYLGINLDQSLSFKERVTRLNNMISSQLDLLSRVLYSPRNDPQPWNDPQIDPEMIPISLHVDLEWSPINSWNGMVFHHWIITNLLQRLRS